MKELIWALSLTAGGIVIITVSLVLFVTFKLRRSRNTRCPPSSKDYVTISSGLDSNVTSCYSTEYVQYPHKQPHIDSAATIPFELPVPRSSSYNGLSPGDSRLIDTASPASLFASNTSLHLPDGDNNLRQSNSSYCLGAIDPDLYHIEDDDDVIYDFPDNHVGRLWFSVEYKPDSERLLVSVLRARNIHTRGFESTCDSYVKIQLMPEKRRTLQTKLRKRTNNPNYEESFVFQVSSRDIEERTLKLSVYHVTKHKKHLLVGHVIYPLREHSLGGDAGVIWRDLERDEEVPAEKGELFVSLCYNNQHERITVGIYQAKEWGSEHQLADYYCKVSVLQQSRMVKTKRTGHIKKTHEPAFNESFTFKLNAAQLDAASISILAMQHFVGHKDKCIGRITLGPFMFARGKALTHWNEMLANPKEQIAYFHKLS